MYPKISDLINDWFGLNINLPIQTYGFFVAMAFLAGAYFLYRELDRKEKEGLLKVTKRTVLKGQPATPVHLFISFIIGFLAGYKLGGFILDYTDFNNDPQHYIFSGRGSWWIGLTTAFAYSLYFYFIRKSRQLNPPQQEDEYTSPKAHTWPILFVAVVFGILGAKVFHWFENWNDFMAAPLESLLSFSGLTFYGGLIVAAVAVAFYGEKNHIHWRYLADAIAPSLILAYGLGRLGCHIAGDGDWGIINTLDKPSWMAFLPDWIWSYNYPHNIINQGIPIPGCIGAHCRQLAEAVFPTPIYETAMALLIFAFLWSIRKRLKTPGLLFAIYLIFNGSERFLIEKIRVNNVFQIFGIRFTQAEMISAVLVLFGIIMWLMFVKWHRKEVANES